MIQFEEIRREAMIDELEKLGYLSKILPKTIGGVAAFPTFRKGVARGIMFARKKINKLPAKIRPQMQSTFRAALTKPDVGAVFLASQPLPIPSSLVAGGYAAVRKKVVKKFISKKAK